MSYQILNQQKICYMENPIFDTSWLVMHSKSDIIEIKINDQAYEVIDKSFASLFNRYQIGLETSMTGNKFVFDFVYLPYYKYHKINSKVMNHI